ncbi:MAG: response regulator transcription factor [Lachnospiraceae bacterium]|nr:response regulator transcription factor [Lachnospiraceae bacterium]
MGKRIMLVEDDHALAKAIKDKVETWGYEVVVAKDFQHISEEFREVQPLLVLLDINLPFFNGFYWCTEIRKQSNVPIVFITSASDNMNIVMAMNMGGDDLIAKPIDLDVLSAKIGAIFRRAYNMNTAPNVLEHRCATLNLNNGTLDYNGKQIDLTKNEFKILTTLLEKKNTIVSRDMLMTKLWQDDCYVEENTLTVNVTRLRKKLEAEGLDEFIKTKVGQGYIIED